MDQYVIDDLKQFIAGTVSQQTAGIHLDIARLEAKIDRVDKKVDDLSQAVAESLDASNEALQAQLKDHDRRITRLERHIT